MLALLSLTSGYCYDILHDGRGGASSLPLAMFKLYFIKILTIIIIIFIAGSSPRRLPVIRRFAQASTRRADFPEAETVAAMSHASRAEDAVAVDEVSPTI